MLTFNRHVEEVTQSTLGEAVPREAGLEEMKTRYRRAAVRQYERWKHLEEGHPRRETADREVPRRTQKRDWRESRREVYEGVMRGLSEVEDVQTVHPPPPPWKTGVPGGVILTGASKADARDVQRGLAEEAMREAGEADLVIFTDGSAEENVRRGGTGVAVYGGEQLLHSWSGAARAACSSYVAERTAMIKAVRWLEEDAPPWSSAVIATDSRSLVDALGGAGAEPHVTALRRAIWSLEEKGRSVTLVWVPGHCGVPGNEEADRLAAEGSTHQQEEIPINGSTRRALIRREVRGSPVRHERLREVYTGELREAEEAQLPRADRVNLTRFRTGHHPSLGRWRAMLGRTEEPTCRLCQLGEEGAEHLWMECTALEGLRRRHQLESPESPRWLTTTS